MPDAVLVAALALPSTASGVEPVRITLDEALRLAAQAPAARVVEKERERALAEVRGAGLWPNPDLSLSREDVAGAIDRFVTVSLPLPLWGRLSAEKNAARRSAAAVLMRAGQDRAELRARVREQFVELLAAQEREAVLQEGLASMEELVRVLKVREAEGESSGFDRRRLERERAEIEADRGEARARLGRARAALAGMLGLPADGLVALGVLAAEGPLPTLDEVRSRAASRGDVLALGAAAEASDLLARAASRRALPEPVLSAGYKESEVDKVSQGGSTVGFAFALPIFDRGQGLRAAATAEAALLRARREALAREVVSEAEATLREAQAHREAESAYASAPAPDELLRIARTAYAEGEMRVLELLDAHRAALAVRLRLVDLRAAARRSEIDVERAMGVLMLPENWTPGAQGGPPAPARPGR